MKYKYRSIREVGGEFFSLKKVNRGKKSLEEYLLMFNIDEYHIIKHTNIFRFLDESELDKYAGFICFKKSVYTKEYLEKYLRFFKENKINLRFLNKPFPPEYILEKIKIIDEI